MESSQGLDNEVLKSSVKPIVEYDPSLQKENVPYRVNVDSEKCTELFRELGMTDEGISEIKIKIKRKPLFKKTPVGQYISGEKEIVIYSDVLWKRLQSYEHKVNSPFEQELSLAKKAIVGENKTAVGLFLHESKHASDFKGNIAKKLGIAFQRTYYLGGVIGIGVLIDKSVPITPLNEILSPLAAFSLPFLAAVNPYEIRARRFANKNKNDPRWENILTLTPKKSNLL